MKGCLTVIAALLFFLCFGWIGVAMVAGAGVALAPVLVPVGIAMVIAAFWKKIDAAWTARDERVYEKKMAEWRRLTHTGRHISPRRGAHEGENE